MTDPIQRVELDFEAWIDFTFGREVVSDFYPFFADREAYWHAPPAVTIDYLTRLFENSAELLRDYDDRQIGGALWPLSSEETHALYSREAPVEARERCIGAVACLFADLFDPRCAPVLGHLDEPGSGPLNSTCYMWWENMTCVALADDPHKPRLDAKVVEVMSAGLELGNPACQESALHGLGHSVRHGPPGIDAIITAYLERDDIRPEIAAYARAARTGCIL